ncbi:MAG: phosphodiester glycosidase family protein [Ferruginibacter sp.]
MSAKKYILFLTILLLITAGIYSFTVISHDDENIIGYQVDIKKQNLKLYWKDKNNQPIKSLGNLKNFLAKNKQELVFAMNAGMYQTDNTPLGLFIQEHKMITALNKRSGNGNFYLKPNGVFYISMDNEATICKTEDFVDNGKIKYATQSGPMLVINGKVHSAFNTGSTNLNIRNGVGILPNNELIFAMSKTGISFYDFANYFKNLGCKNALYLDGFVSRTYLPEMNWIQFDGNFGVMIGVTRNIQQ